MASVNKVILLGNLGRDPELRYTKSGQAVANFSIATSERFSSREGDAQERTEWHNIVTWGRTAENCAQYLSKGSSAYIEGRLQTRDWEDREGNKRRTTEVVAQTVQFLNTRRGGGSAQPPGGGSSQPPGGGGAPPTAGGGAGPSGGAGAREDPGPPPADDIPF